MDAASSSPSCPFTPQWNIDRPFLTGQFHQVILTSGFTESVRNSMDVLSMGSEKPIGCYNVSVQELLVIDDFLSALIGTEGRYMSIKRVSGKDSISFHVDGSMDLALQDSTKWIFPLCQSYLLINQFVVSRSQFKTGLVNHDFAAALRSLLLISSYVRC